MDPKVSSDQSKDKRSLLEHNTHLVLGLCEPTSAETSCIEFEQCYKENIELIGRYIYCRVDDADLAQDLTSITFFKALISYHQFRGGNALLWLRRIAFHVISDHYRSEKRYPTDPLPDSDFDIRDPSIEPIDNVIAVLQGAAIRDALSKLPSIYRKVIILHFFGGLSYPEIGEMLGITAANAKVCGFRALKKLAKVIDPNWLNDENEKSEELAK